MLKGTDEGTGHWITVLLSSPGERGLSKGQGKEYGNIPKSVLHNSRLASNE